MPYAAKTHRQTLNARLPQQKRRTTAERGYGGRWQRFRALYLQRHPVCRCGQATTQVDHVLPHRGDYNLMWSESNMQAMCASCHRRKTAREDGGFGQ